MLLSERETILRWDSEEEMVHVYTCHPTVKRKIEKAGFANLRSRKQKGKEVSWFFSIPLAEFRWRIGRRKHTGGRNIAAIIAEKNSTE